MNLGHALGSSAAAITPTLIGRLYEHFANLKGNGGRLWGDKNNPFHHYVFVLRRLFPNARFLHLVRDGRAVYGSFVELGRKEGQAEYFPSLPNSPEQAAAQWVSAVRQIERSLQTSANALTVRYEDLVTDFESIMTTVCQFLGLQYEPAMRDFHSLNRTQQLEPREYDTWKWRTREQVTTSSYASVEGNLDREPATCFRRFGRVNTASSSLFPLWHRLRTATAAAITAAIRPSFGLGKVDINAVDGSSIRSSQHGPRLDKRR